MMEKTDDVRMHGAPHATAPPVPRHPPRHGTLHATAPSTPQPNRSSSVTGPSDRGRESLTPEDSRTLRANGQTNVTNTKRQPDNHQTRSQSGHRNQLPNTGIQQPRAGHNRQRHTLAHTQPESLHVSGCVRRPAPGRGPRAAREAREMHFEVTP